MVLQSSVLALVLAVAAPITGAGSVAAQSVLDRPPNMHGIWAGSSGTVYFHFLHRFIDTGPPLRKVINYPSFLLGASLPHDVLVGLRYSTNSELVPRVPNEWEAFARYTPLREEAGWPLTLSAQGSYNEAARSWDGELEVARELGRLRLLAAGRVFSDAFATGESRVAVAAGATFRLLEYLALSADYARLMDLEASEADPAWGVGVQTAIPYTPHSLSLQVSNASTGTAQGASLGFSRLRWGFEFTVPLTLSRYFGSRPARAVAASAPARGDPVEVGMTNRLEFTPDTVRITVGEAVRWRNTSDVVHTVTADPSKAVNPSNVRLPDGATPFDSGDLAPGATFEHTFTVPGEYLYFCIPHELAGMTAMVLVTES
jgi:plastocyanin